MDPRREPTESATLVPEPTLPERCIRRRSCSVMPVQTSQGLVTKSHSRQRTPHKYLSVSAIIWPHSPRFCPNISYELETGQLQACNYRGGQQRKGKVTVVILCGRLDRAAKPGSPVAHDAQRSPQYQTKQLASKVCANAHKLVTKNKINKLNNSTKWGEKNG